MPSKTETRPNGLTLHFDYSHEDGYFYNIIRKWVYDAKVRCSQFPGIVGSARASGSQTEACKHAEENLMRKLGEKSKPACSISNFPWHN